MENKFDYKSCLGNIVQVQISVWIYGSNNSLYVELLTAGEESELYAPVTVNLWGDIPDYCAYIDTNNSVYIEEFLVKYKIAKNTGRIFKSGFCTYPMYLFDEKRLRELCPEGMSLYESKNRISNNLDCFIPEPDIPYPLCIGQGKAECVECQLRADWEPEEDPYL